METIWGVRFSPAMLPVATGVDGGVSRRPWDLRQRRLLLEFWRLGRREDRVPLVK
ncbi:hypothetical protein DEO72_LG6g1103 [Vigna unguiculata]|uniref:Uncharacterized protein n=1 Tax=Vigna unguiculata TaxID=3917 RepID=A0A4D6M7L1_VIGUN|nr:hypothetical protein DEO72_LG6g1103 [Vigna unguiculata]